MASGSGKLTAVQASLNRRSISFKRQRTEHEAPVGGPLIQGQRSITIAIDIREDRVRHVDPRRQVELEMDRVRLDRQSRGLEVLVPSMRGHLGDGGDDR